MHALLELISNLIQNSAFTATFLDAALKSFLVLSLAMGVCFCWRSASAATQHLIWLLAVVSLLCLPLLSPMLPSWQRPLWSVSTRFDSGNEFSLALELTPFSRPGFAQDQTPTPTPKPMTSGAGELRSVKIQRIAAHFSTDWLGFAFIAWASGALLLLLLTVAGWLRLRRLSRQASSLLDAEWTTLLRDLCAELRIRRTVFLLKSGGHLMPMTWGWWRPVVLLPSEADQWPAERRRLVMQHELGHVKRWDCLTQLITRIVCAFYWFNPLVWLAARRMRDEREHACDDLVLNRGWKPSEYASHLFEIARAFRHVPPAAAIAMTRPSQLEERLAAIVDASRRRYLRSGTLTAVLVVAGGIAVCLAGCQTTAFRSSAGEARLLREQQIARLKEFSVEKEKQSQTLAAAAGETISPEFQRFFDAAQSGDWQTVTNRYAYYKRHHGQYTNSGADVTLRTSYWQPVLEISLAYDMVVNCEPKYNQMAIDGITTSIPPGSIYFGGTDPGRGLPTAFCKSHVNADPFFTLTQNALADGTYLIYLRAMYGGSIYIPTGKDSENCFQEYLGDAQRRLRHDTEHPKEPKQIKPGEDVRLVKEGGMERVQVSGQVSVMSINGRLTKVVFDRNPDREFYTEESFPLDWMYPHLEPRGLILKINRNPLPELSEDIIRRDHDYWTKCVRPMLGDWITHDTPVQQIAAFVEKVYLKHDFRGFSGDPRFIQNADAQRMFSKLRAAIGGIYAWRSGRMPWPLAHAASGPEKTRMTREADFAYRQAWALCPDSPEAVFRYVQLLVNTDRYDDGLLIASTCQKLAPSNSQVSALVKNLAVATKTQRGKRNQSAQQAIGDRRKMPVETFEKRRAQDQERYTAAQLQEADQLYQVASQKWGSPEATQSLQALIKKYPDINRAGCAMLYLAQTSQGDERVKYLQECIEKYNDCMYGDGVQVGVYARFLLAQEYQSKGEGKKAAALNNEIKAKYGDAIDHTGKLLVTSIEADSK